MKEMLIFNVEVGDMPKEYIGSHMKQLRDIISPQLKELDCGYLFIPTNNGKGKISLADPNSTLCFCIDGKCDKNIEVTSEQLLKLVECRK